MKLTVPTKTLLEAVAPAAAVAASKSPKPILECVALRADPKTGLSIEATDLDVGVRLHIPDADVQEGGGLVIPAARLLAICREVDEAETMLVDDGGGLVLDTGRSHFRVRGEPIEEFPKLPTFPAKGSLSLPSAVMQAMIRRTAFATAKEAGRFALHGVQLSLSGKKVEMVATDGRRLARATATLPKKIGTELKAIIGPKALQLVERILGSDIPELHIAMEERQILFQVGSALVVSRLIDGTFPSLDGVIPAKSDHVFKSTAADFASGLRRASLLTTRDAMSVELQITPGSLVIRSRARDVGEAKVEVPVDYDGAPQTVGFNPGYLQEALKVMEPSSEIRFEFSNAKSPGKLTDSDDYTYVVMPVSLE
jgi:DNA polymerase-3 subunit beta